VRLGAQTSAVAPSIASRIAGVQSQFPGRSTTTSRASACFASQLAE
jgi:hypothetical protein